MDSRADHLAMDAEELLKKMMFDVRSAYGPAGFEEKV